MASCTRLIAFLALVSSALSLVVNDCGNLPTPRRLTAAVYDGEDFVYILGGIDTGPSDTEPRPTNQILRYDLRTNETTTLDITFATPVYHGAVARDPTGIIYYLGGGDIYNHTTPLHTGIFRFDPSQTGPLELSPIGNLGAGLGGATAHFIESTGEVFIFGGENDVEILSDVTAYNPTTNVFRPLENLPYPVSRAASAVVGASAYIFSGVGNGSATPILTQNVLRVKVPEGRNEVFGPRLFYGVESAVAVNTGEFVYVIGGFIGGSYPYQHVTEVNVATKEVLSVCVAEEYRRLPQEASAIYSEKHQQIVIFGGYTNETQSQVLCIPMESIVREPCEPPTEAGASFLEISAFLLLSVVGLTHLL